MWLRPTIRNPQSPGGFKEFTKLPSSIGKAIQVRSSFPARVEREVQEPTTWTLRFFVPFALFERYVGALGPIGGMSLNQRVEHVSDARRYPSCQAAKLALAGLRQRARRQVCPQRAERK